jgi:hypothetical protein
MIMWNEDVYNSTTSLVSWWGAFFTEVANEYGEDKALELFLKPWKRYTTANATRLSQIQELDLNVIADQSVKDWINRGADRSAEVTPTSIIYTTNKCPWYSGFSEAGLSHETIKTLCTSISDMLDSRMKELYHPNAGYQINFRSNADNVCLEEVILKPQEEAS